MAKIETMDKAAARALHAATLDALKKVGEDFGVVVAIKGGTFDPFAGLWRPRLEMSLPTVGGKDRDRAEWDLYCRSYHLDPEDFGKTFQNRGKEYRLVGFSPKRTKYPYRAVGPDGKEMLFTYQCLRTVNKAAYDFWSPVATVVPLEHVLQKVEK